MPPFSKDQIKEFLAQYGYTSDPEGLIEFTDNCYVHVSDNEMYLDINATAVRKGNEFPIRPVRMTFRKILHGPSDGWELISVDVLAAGIETKALHREFPWPEKMS
jgi:hypothetical protein